MRSFIDFAVIQPRFDGVNHGDPVMPCRVTFLGESPNSTVKAMQWDREAGSFVDYDRLTEAVVVDKGNQVIVTGKSDALVFDNLLEPADAQTEWVIDIRGCQGCS